MTDDWFITVPLAARLGLTLVHVLWEAAAGAGVLAGVLVMSRSRRPEFRYGLAFFTLVALCVAAVVTFVVLPVERINAAPPLPPARFSAMSTARFVGHEMFEQSTPRAAATGLPQDTTVSPQPFRAAAMLPALAGAWVAGVTLLAGYRLIGWMVVRRQLSFARRIDGPWAADLSVLQEAARVGGRVRWLASEREQVPFVVGWWTPTVVIPRSARETLSRDELHAVLCHELAHVQRGDYRANLLQTAIETLLFFHPAVGWISGVIRAEREHCCDDAAVRQGGSVSVYARALARLETLRQPEGAALAANGTSLLPRLRRLVDGRSPAPLGWRLALGIGAAVLAVPFASVRLMAQVVSPASTKPADTNIITSADTAPMGTSTPPATQAAEPYTPSPQQADFLKLVGSGTMGRLAAPLLERFAADHPRVLTQTALYGSHWVSEELLNPQDHWGNVGLMSRPMNAEEHVQFRQRMGHDPIEILMARDGILILVNEKNTLPGITLPQLDALYGTDRKAGFVGPAKVWSDLGATGDLAATAIDPYGLLEQDQGTVETFRRIVLLGGPINTLIRNIPLPEHEWGQSVSADLGGISYNIDHAPVPGAKALPVAAGPGKPFVAATDATIGDGTYPLSRGLYLYLPDTKDEVANDFVRFVLSAAGQAVIAQTGQAVALPPQVAAVELNRARL